VTGPASEDVTVASLLLARRQDPRPGLRFEERAWNWSEHVQASASRAAWLETLRRPGPFHVGVLLDNVPEFSFLLGAAALSDLVVVGLNPTFRGAELAASVSHTDCQLIVTEARHRPLLEGLELPFGADRIIDIDSEEFGPTLAAFADAPIPDQERDPDELMMLIFTSGTSGAPKAVRCTQRKIGFPGVNLSERFGLAADDVCYLAMPLFHSNAMMAGWGPALAAGATMVLRRRFSASGFLPDVRRYGVTYFNYVGKPLSYILATEARPDDGDNPLRIAFGNEGADRDVKRFADRFGCTVVDGFGSTEGGVIVSRTPDTPEGALGRPAPGVQILDPDTMSPCPPARFSPSGELLNAEEAIGELVNTAGAGSFEGYYRDDEADAERMRRGWYWSGDLAFADEEGFYYFAGRTIERLRVDGENFTAAPVERILMRHPDVVLAAVYAVPATDVGDEVMAALALVPGARFDPAGFGEFLAAQADLGAKWAPRFVRVSEALPQTETNKVLKRQLAAERWTGDDPIWWRPGRQDGYRRLTTADAEALDAALARNHPRSLAGAR